MCSELLLIFKKKISIKFILYFLKINIGGALMYIDRRVGSINLLATPFGI